MKYGLIGAKLGHSFSKEIHERLGGYEYELIELEPDELGTFITARDFDGINVTIPYKEAVIPYLDEVSGVASSIGAVNTIVNKDGRLTGYNTDAGGMRRLIERICSDVKDKTVLIAGSGGTSKTAYHVVSDMGAGEALRISRREVDGCISYEQAYADHPNAEIIINTTPVGMYPKVDGAPLDIGRLKRLEAVIDAVYNPLRSELVRDAQDRGIAAEGGLYMLTSQALLAAELFGAKIESRDVFDMVYAEVLMDKQNIALIGMPGCGKSTIGRMLADELGKDFIDTDDLIVKRCGTEVREIFSEHGEEYFRDIESDVIKEVSLESGKVIACGGGAVLRDENRRALSMNGSIVFIDRDIHELRPTADRPLADDLEKIEALYRDRMPVYREAADVIVSVTGYGSAATEKIRRALL